MWDYLVTSIFRPLIYSNPRFLNLTMFLSLAYFQYFPTIMPLRILTTIFLEEVQFTCLVLLWIWFLKLDSSELSTGRAIFFISKFRLYAIGFLIFSLMSMFVCLLACMCTTCMHAEPMKLNPKLLQGWQVLLTFDQFLQSSFYIL